MDVNVNIWNVKSPCANVKPPVEDFLAMVLLPPCVVAIDFKLGS